MQKTRQTKDSYPLKPYIIAIVLGFFILSLPFYQPDSVDHFELSEENKQELAKVSKQRPFLLFQAIPLNNANHQQLISVPGIGPTLAKRIITYRNQHGPFDSFDALLQVNGIGPQKLERLKKFCRL